MAHGLEAGSSPMHTAPRQRSQGRGCAPTWAAGGAKWSALTSSPSSLSPRPRLGPEGPRLPAPWTRSFSPCTHNHAHKPYCWGAPRTGVRARTLPTACMLRAAGSHQRKCLQPKTHTHARSSTRTHEHTHKHTHSRSLFAAMGVPKMEVHVMGVMVVPNTEKGA